MKCAMTNRSLGSWLKMQVRVLEAWREELAMHADIDMGTILRLERHYQWLTGEVAALERSADLRSFQ